MKALIQKAEHHLKTVDPVIARLIKSHGPCTLYSERGLMNRSGFHAIAWAIINQQLSVASARSIENKLLSLLDSKEFRPAEIAELSDEQLASCGLSRQKLRYLRALCEAVNSGQLDFSLLAKAEDSTVSEQLIALPGIGPWTVDMYLMFSLGRADVLPLGDLALRKAFNQFYKIKDPRQLEFYRLLAEPWRPYRSIASWYLWASVD